MFLLYILSLIGTHRSSSFTLLLFLMQLLLLYLLALRAEKFICQYLFRYIINWLNNCLSKLSIWH